MVTITQLSPDRWKEYKELRLESLRDFPVSFDSSVDEEENLSDEQWQEKFSNPTNYIIFAEDDGKLVGKMEVEWDPRRNIKHIGEIFGVYIKPAYQGQGIGMRLWEEVEKIAKTKGIEKFWLDVISINESAIHLYKKMGFQTLCTREKAAKVDGVYYDKLLMEQFI